MAHFYGELKGNKGETTRAGTKNSGLSSHIRGWNNGVYTEMYRENDEDHFKVYKTGGSSNENNKQLIYDSYNKVLTENFDHKINDLEKALNLIQ